MWVSGSRESCILGSTCSSCPRDLREKLCLLFLWRSFKISLTANLTYGKPGLRQPWNRVLRVFPTSGASSGPACSAPALCPLMFSHHRLPRYLLVSFMLIFSESLCSSALFVMRMGRGIILIQRPRTRNQLTRISLPFAYSTLGSGKGGVTLPYQALPACWSPISA